MMYIKPEPLLCQRIFFLSLFSYCAFLFFSCSETKPKDVAAPGQVFRDVQYGTAPDTANKEQALTFDAYFPAGNESGKKYPLVMMIHGGGFLEGDKKEMAKHCSLLADSGYIGVSLNYRLGWQSGLKNCDGDTMSQYDALYRAIQDANAALRFLVSNRETYHIDTSRMFIGGGSAGATIAMYRQYLPAALAMKQFPAQYARLGALNKGGNSLTDTFSIKGILCMWGCMGDSTLINGFNAIPMIFFHGTADVTLPYNMGREFSCDAYPVVFGSACLSRQLAHYHVPYQLYLKKAGAHAPAAYHAPVTIPLAVRFFNNISKGTPQQDKIMLE